MTWLLPFVLYAAAYAAGLLVAIPQAILIQSNKPIRHGLWLSAYIVVGFLSAWMTMPSAACALLASAGMAGVFSASFRFYLNDLRELPTGYLGPDPANGPAPGRSRYDMLMWRTARYFRCPPVRVALFLELGTAAAVYIILVLECNN
jgi:energy-converting hydrogenase Eha subunit A